MTDVVSIDALQIKLADVQRTLWKNFNNTATLQVALKEVEGTITYEETFKPGPELKGI